MTEYVLTGEPAPGTVEASLVEGRTVGDVFEADLSEEQERQLAGAGVLSRTEGETLQPEPTLSGAQSMNVPPHTAEPGAGYDENSQPMQAAVPSEEYSEGDQPANAGAMPVEEQQQYGTEE